MLTTLYACVHAGALVLRRRPSLLLCNGPGTCIPICAAALMLRVLGIKYVTIIYAESVCRVRSLSMSGEQRSPLLAHLPPVPGKATH